MKPLINMFYDKMKKDYEEVIIRRLDTSDNLTIKLYYQGQLQFVIYRPNIMIIKNPNYDYSRVVHTKVTNTTFDTKIIDKLEICDGSTLLASKDLNNQIIPVMSSIEINYEFSMMMRLMR